MAITRTARGEALGDGRNGLADTPAEQFRHGFGGFDAGGEARNGTVSVRAATEGIPESTSPLALPAGEVGFTRGIDAARADVARLGASAPGLARAAGLVRAASLADAQGSR